MLLDTSGLLSYLDADDPRHADAVTLLDAAPHRITHSYVLAELVALAHARRVNRNTTLDFIAEVMDDADFEVAWVDQSLHRSAFALLRDRGDKTYSLCDAVSFVLMRQRGVTEAFTTDHHFEQEGFVRLLKP
jgi:predicted nucleic acid-binding protein